MCPDHEIVQELGRGQRGGLHRLTVADRERLGAVDGATPLAGQAAALVWSTDHADLWSPGDTDDHLVGADEVAGLECPSLTMLLAQVVREHTPPPSPPSFPSPAPDALVAHARAHCRLGSEFPETRPVERLRAPISERRPAETDEPEREGFVKLREAVGPWQARGAEGRRYEARPVEHRDAGGAWETREVDVHNPRPLVGGPDSRVTAHDGRTLRTLHEAERLVNAYERGAASCDRIREDHLGRHAQNKERRNTLPGRIRRSEGRVRPKAVRHDRVRSR